MTTRGLDIMSSFDFYECSSILSELLFSGTDIAIDESAVFFVFL
jgi:hypothetical protein